MSGRSHQPRAAQELLYNTLQFGERLQGRPRPRADDDVVTLAQAAMQLPQSRPQPPFAAVAQHGPAQPFAGNNAVAIVGPVIASDSQPKRRMPIAPALLARAGEIRRVPQP